MERCRAETLAATNGDRVVALRSATNVLAAEEEAVQEYESKHRKASAMVEALRAAVSDMFNSTGWAAACLGAAGFAGRLRKGSALGCRAAAAVMRAAGRCCLQVLAKPDSSAPRALACKACSRPWLLDPPAAALCQKCWNCWVARA